ncbi:DUF4212 domain-containing protein [Magnetofaba australis]|uniref:Putative membrane protein n=1 Tax=Magnetofaba australis IT-1 TaxID=1434232 RepID=A0A1Y2K5N3_9PROT|nr:DUF4212 domain-containing protein [Magnetofaba australis]OSM04994.1 putative membrane protein [Magnetofaba australis IT-1]
MSQSGSGEEYWKANVSLIVKLLVIWFLCSYGCGIMFADYLNQFMILGGYPLGFWFAQQGSIYVFLLLLFIYAVRMNALDRKFGVRED